MSLNVWDTRKSIAEGIRNALLDDGLVGATHEEHEAPIAYTVFRHDRGEHESNGTLTPTGDVWMNLPVQVESHQVGFWFRDDVEGETWPVVVVIRGDRTEPEGTRESSRALCASAAAFLAEGELGGYTHDVREMPVDTTEEQMASVGIVEADGSAGCAALYMDLEGVEYIADVTVLVGRPRRYTHEAPRSWTDIYDWVRQAAWPSLPVGGAAVCPTTLP